MTLPNPMLVTIPNNLGMSFENIVLLILVGGSLALFAKDFKIGLIGLFVTLAVDVVLLYENGLNWAPGLLVFFMIFVIMCFSLYAVSRQGAGRVMV